MGREAQGKTLGGVVLARAVARTAVGNPPDAVFLLQVDIHHRGLRPTGPHSIAHVDVLVHHLVQVGLQVVDLDVLHHVARQVLQRYARIAPEEVLAVNQQVGDPLAVHVNHAALAQLGTGQHGY